MSKLWRVRPPIEAKHGVWVGPAPDRGIGLRLGSLAEVVSSGIPAVWLSTAKEQVIAVVGKRGSGKSFTLGVIAEGFAVRGAPPVLVKGASPRAVLLFDPLDVYWTTRYSVTPSNNPEAQRHFKLAEQDGVAGFDFDVEAWVPGDGFRRPTDPDWFRTFQLPVSALGPDDWEPLLNLNFVTDPMGQCLADCVTLAGAAGYTVDTGAVPPRTNFDLSSLIACATSVELTRTYHAETLRALRQRLNTLEATGLFSGTGTSIRNLLAPGRLTVLMLGRLPQSYRAALVAIVTRLLVEARSETAFAEKRRALDPQLSPEARRALDETLAHGVPRTVVALDEAQVFLAPGASNTAREVFVRLAKEGRNIGLSCVLATQQPSAIDQRILSQVETFLAHQLVTEGDIRAVRDNLKSGLPESIEFAQRTALDFSSLLRELQPGTCLVSAADLNVAVRRCLVAAIRPRATIHGGMEL